MLKVLDRDPHTGRLGDLLRRFHAQELSMGRALQEMQAELEYWQREAPSTRTGCCWPRRSPRRGPAPEPERAAAAPDRRRPGRPPLHSLLLNSIVEL